jgi:hypothetical protein
MTRRTLGAISVAVVATPCALGAQVEVRGRTVSETAHPIAGTIVTVGGIGYSVRSDSAGRFALSGARGTRLNLYFTAPGYRRDSVSLVLGRAAVTRDFTLARSDATVPESNPSSTVLRGRVFDESGAPLSYPNVQLNYGTRVVGDDSGRFQLPFAATARGTIFVRRIGFEPVELPLASRPDTALRVVLTAIPVQLKEVTVAATTAFRSLDIHGFYGRMRDAERGHYRGWFFTPEDIARRNTTWTTQMADGLPTVRVKRSPMPSFDVIVGARDCPMTVYLDNIRITNRLQGRSDFVNELVPVTHVAAMEIYPRALGAPPQYLPLRGSCGVVLIWTK